MSVPPARSRGRGRANPYVESFNGRLRAELLAIEEFGTLLEAQIVIEAWRGEYSTQRPHSNLGWLSPAAYAERWGNSNQRDCRKRWTRYWGPVRSGAAWGCSIATIE